MSQTNKSRTFAQHSVSKIAQHQAPLGIVYLPPPFIPLLFYHSDGRIAGHTEFSTHRSGTATAVASITAVDAELYGSTSHSFFMRSIPRTNFNRKPPRIKQTPLPHNTPKRFAGRVLPCQRISPHGGLAIHVHVGDRR